MLTRDEIERMSESEGEREVRELIAKADATMRIMAVAFICSVTGQDGTNIVKGRTRADFKRAIKRLRVLQREDPRYAAHYEETIAHIRRVWLHDGTME